MHIATNVLREETQSLGAKTKKVSLQGGELPLAPSQRTTYMHITQVPTGLLSTFARPVRSVSSCLVSRPISVSALLLGASDIAFATAEGTQYLMVTLVCCQGVLARLYHLVSHSPSVNHLLGLLGLLGLRLR